MNTDINYYFSWDNQKAASNKRKHGISFEVASGVFHDALTVTIPDEAHSFTEERWITLGRASSQKLILVVHTYIEVKQNRVDIRMISARPATKHEQRQYEESYP